MNRSTQQPSDSPLQVYWDLLIIALVATNLALILFDSLFALAPAAAAVEWLSPTFHHWYRDSIHANFQHIDLAFVAIFLADVLIGWAAAIWQRRYHRWFFYPFVHWYDVLGCIPLAGFRWLRALRVLALLLRLHRLGWIDIKHWRIYRVCYKYYDILLEELSDRIVVKVLSGVQEEVMAGGGELPAQLAEEVLRPRQQALVDAIAGGISDVVNSGYQDNREEIRDFVAGIVRGSVQRNAAARGLEKVPLVGSRVVGIIDDTIADTIGDAVDEAMRELNEMEYAALIDHITDAVLQRMSSGGGGEPHGGWRAMVADTLELLKQQVSEQRWKQHYS